MSIRIGILSPSNIAFRRFLPALKKCAGMEYVGVAYAAREEWFGGDVPPSEWEKAEEFAKSYGGEVTEGYRRLIARPDVDAVYVPLPPALHFAWGREVLNAGKHLFLEKPFTTNLRDTEELLALAKEKSLAVHENYMFVYHSQLARIKRMIAEGETGDIRLFRMAFGFPKRPGNDFRYVRSLGGGALLDCGGYPTRLAQELLGDSLRIVQAKLTQPEGYEVDLYGNAVLENDLGQCAQISFGMDNAYQCQLEVWGSRETVIAPRIFTAGADVTPSLTIRTSTDESTVQLEADDQFQHSIELFAASCADPGAAPADKIRRQSGLIEEIRKRG